MIYPFIALIAAITLVAHWPEAGLRNATRAELVGLLVAGLTLAYSTWQLVLVAAGSVPL